MKKYCSISNDAEKYLNSIFDKFEFSARAYHKILKVARTIADLNGVEEINTSHVSEAVCYRVTDRKYWGCDI